MNIQNSFIENDRGKLYIVPTPIGNLDDITFRAIDILNKVELIAAEDTRHTKKLLNHFEIQNELISYHEHNRFERIPLLIDKLMNGSEIALVSDAGMPAISDPGSELVAEAVKQQISVIVLPGANAALSALVGSGLPTEQFYFYGFLPRKKSDKEKVLNQLKQLEATIIFYESPHRVLQTLENIEKQFGLRRIALARELTKLYEQYIRGSVREVIDFVKDNPLRGECVIVVEGATEVDVQQAGMWWEELTLEEHVQYYEREKNVTHKEAMKLVAQDRQLSRRDVYNAIHVKKEK